MEPRGTLGPMRYQPEEAADTPRWGLPRAVIVMLGIAGAVIVVAGVKSFSSVIGPAVFALMLIVAIHPLQSCLRRKGFSRVAGRCRRGRGGLRNPAGLTGRVTGVDRAVRQILPAHGSSSG